MQDSFFFKHRYYLGFVSYLLSFAGCSEAIYPPRPSIEAGAPVADPSPSRLHLHTQITAQGIAQILDAFIPQEGMGQFEFFGDRRYQYKRAAFQVTLNDGQKLELSTQITTTVELPGKTTTFVIDTKVQANPVLSSQYQLSLQSLSITLQTHDRLLKMAEWMGGLLSTIKNAVEIKLKSTTIDLSPSVLQLYNQVSAPFYFQIGQAQGCAQLQIPSIQTTPHLLLGAFEKDFAFTLVPSVTLPCQAAQPSSLPSLPVLQNVAQVPTGPSILSIPMAASYEELQKSMLQVFTNGKLFFSKEHPYLYIEKPEIYASFGEVVVKVHLAGFVQKGFRINLEGDLYLMGHPQVRDNELEFPDLRPTIETKSALLKLKTRLDAEDIQYQVRKALRLDISKKLQSTKQQLEQALSQRFYLDPKQKTTGCTQTQLGRIEIGGVYAHQSYLRTYINVSLQTALLIPCP